MKVGLIFECGPDGADKKVIEYLTRLLKPDIEIESITLDNKPNLVREAGNATGQLLANECERIIIVWDLYPPWRDTNPCRREDRDNIRISLANAGVNSPHVYLVCIEEELEAWLLADERALADVLSRPAHPVKIRRIRNTERTRNPKTRLNKIFQENGRPRYNDLVDAERIVRALPDFNRLKRCAAFVRFAVKVTGREDILTR